MADSALAANPPTKDEVLASLAAAADAARQAYMAAQAANPGADLGQLYTREMKAAAAWATAEDAALSNDPNVAKAQADLDAATKDIRAKLGNLTDIKTWLTLLDNVAKLAGTVAGFFA
jgi:hypothetical protein